MEAWITERIAINKIKIAELQKEVDNLESIEIISNIVGTATQQY